MKAFLVAAGFSLLLTSMVNAVIPGGVPAYSTAWATVSSVVVSSEPEFTRGHTSTSGVPWQKMPCKNEATGAWYQSEILSSAEIEHNLVKAGFTPENAHIMMAVSKAESGHQLECVGDEVLTNPKWTYSYGLYQIRGLVAEQGKGSCRDIQSLGKDVFRQSQCAFEISGGGVNFSPWSMWTNGRFREYL